MDYETVATPTSVVTAGPTVPGNSDTMHSDSDTDSKCSHNSESSDVRNVPNLSQDILQTMIQSCRRLAANELTVAAAAVRCECSRNLVDVDRKLASGDVQKCEKCVGAKFSLNLSESFQKDKSNTIINEPVKPVLKFSVSAILSGTKSSPSDDRILKSSSRNGKKALGYCFYSLAVYDDAGEFMVI